MKERSKRRDRSASANNRRNKRQEEEEEEEQLRFSLSILISCVDFHKMGIILNHVSPLLLDWHGLTIRFHY